MRECRRYTKTAWKELLLTPFPHEFRPKLPISPSFAFVLNCLLTNRQQRYQSAPFCFDHAAKWRFINKSAKIQLQSSWNVHTIQTHRVDKTTLRATRSSFGNYLVNVLWCIMRDFYDPIRTRPRRTILRLRIKRAPADTFAEIKVPQARWMLIVLAPQKIVRSFEQTAKNNRALKVSISRNRCWRDTKTVSSYCQMGYSSPHLAPLIQLNLPFLRLIEKVNYSLTLAKDASY